MTSENDSGANFNTSKVRFRVVCAFDVVFSHWIFQYLKGAIQRGGAAGHHGDRDAISIPQRCDSEYIVRAHAVDEDRISIPQRCDSECVGGVGVCGETLFQYLKGAIQRIRVVGGYDPPHLFQYLKGAIQRTRRVAVFPKGSANFNTSKVRFRVGNRVIANFRAKLFQYLKGAIQS